VKALEKSVVGGHAKTMQSDFFLWESFPDTLGKRYILSRVDLPEWMSAWQEEQRFSDFRY